MDRSLRDADAVVVGAGPGGLTTAAYLAACGRRVVVVDRHSVAGGNATVFTHHGYEFDVGVHYLGDCAPGGGIPRILAPLGIELAFRELDPDGFDTLVFPDQTFRIPKGVDAFRARLEEAFPSERDAIGGYLDTVVALDRGLTGGGDFGVVLQHADRTVGDLFDDLRASPRLRSVLDAQNGTYALPPSRASLVLHSVLVMHYLKGAYYPEGGGQVIADALAATIRAHGGEIVLQTPVESIIVEDGAARGVRLRPPSPLRRRGVPDEIRTPVVVSNADLKRTVLDLVGPEHFPAEYVDAVRRYRMSLPLVALYLVIDRDLRAEGHPNTNLYAIPSDDIEGAYATVESGAMPAEPPTYLTFASLKDPGNPRLCRPGQTNLQAMTLAPAQYSYWGLERGPAAGERYRRNRVYRQRKRELRDSLLRMAERLLPGITDQVAYEEIATPVTHERFVRSTGGTSYGIELSPDQFLAHRPAPATPLPGLYLTGASTMGGHGIAGTMGGGVMAASAIAGAAVQELLGSRLSARATG